jgi:peptide/nickel transport system substrate-binding protein
MARLHGKTRQTFGRLLIPAVLTCALLLSGCEIRGGVERPGLEEPTAPSAAASSVPAPSVVADTPVPLERTLRIGLATDPGDLLPFHSDSADERITAPLTELLFPEPLLTVGYQYTTTGVLTQVPSLENGDVQFGQVDVYLDSIGLITTTVTEVITQVTQISVIYRWNPELRWSDGTPVTAADSVFAFELAQRFSLGQAADVRLNLLESYEALDDYTTRAVLKADFTDPGFLSAYWTPLPRHLLADAMTSTSLRDLPFAVRPIGYGPYVVDRREEGSVRLRRNEYFSADAPLFDVISVVFRDNLDLLRTSVVGGGLDVVALDQVAPERLAALRTDAGTGSIALVTTASPVWEHLDFNLDIALFQDIRMRRAIAHAINRDAIVNDLLAGYGDVLHSWIVPGQFAAVPADALTTYAFSVEEATRLLDEIGLLDTNGDGLREQDGEPLTLRLVTSSTSPLRTAVAERIAANLSRVGIALEVSELPTAELYSPEGPLYRRTFELALFAWIAGPDPRGYERWSCVGVPNEANGWSGNNFPGWCFFEADQAIRTATTELDRDMRLAAYRRQQELFTQELPVLPLFQRVDAAFARPTLIGVSSDPTAPFTWNMAAWQDTANP